MTGEAGRRSAGPAPAEQRRPGRRPARACYAGSAAPPPACVRCGSWPSPVASPVGGAALKPVVPDWRSPAELDRLRSLLLPSLAAPGCCSRATLDRRARQRQLGAARERRASATSRSAAGLDLALYVGDTLVPRGPRAGRRRSALLPDSSAPAETVHQALVRQGFGTADGRALDSVTLIRTLDQASAGDVLATAKADALCRSLLRVVAAASAVADPELLVLGGPVGRHPWLLARLQLAAQALRRCRYRSSPARWTARPRSAGPCCAVWPRDSRPCSGQRSESRPGRMGATCPSCPRWRALAPRSSGRRWTAASSTWTTPTAGSAGRTRRARSARRWSAGG